MAVRRSDDIGVALLLLLHGETEGILTHILLPQEYLEHHHEDEHRRPLEGDSPIYREEGDGSSVRESQLCTWQAEIDSKRRNIQTYYDLQSKGATFEIFDHQQETLDPTYDAEESQDQDVSKRVWICSFQL